MATATPLPRTAAAEIVGFVLPNVSVRQGDSVVWTNRDGSTHTATSGQSPNADGRWNSGAISQNRSSQAVVMSAAGSFPYFCAIHTGMQATVTVTG